MRSVVAFGCFLMLGFGVACGGGESTTDDTETDDTGTASTSSTSTAATMATSATTGTSGTTETSGPEADTGTTGGQSSGETGTAGSDSTSDTGTSTDGTSAGTAGSTGGVMPVCGDGLVEPPEMCEPTEADCQDDCTYPSGLIFWTDLLPGVSPGARAWGVAFDEDDAPFATVARSGSVGNGAGAWVKKYERDGSEVWYERWIDASWDLVHAYAVTARPGGSIVITGQVNTGATGNDGFFGQMSATGTVGWGRQFSGDHNDWLEDIVALADGSVVAVGAHNQDPNLDDRGWIVKLSSTGQEDWQLEIDGLNTADGEVKEVDVLPDGKIVTFGCCLDGGAFLLRAYEPNGAEAWTATLPELTNAWFIASGMAVDVEGNVVATWITDANEVWLGKYSSTGAEIWSKTATDAAFTAVQPTALVATPQGKYFLGGVDYSGANGDIFYATLDQDGELLWSDTVAGSGGSGDRVLNLAVDSRGVVLIGGEINNGDLTGWVRMIAP